MYPWRQQLDPVAGDGPGMLVLLVVVLALPLLVIQYC